MRDDAQQPAQPAQPVNPTRLQAVSLWNQSVPLSSPGASEQDKNLAYRMWLSAVDLDPDFHQAWYALGNANSDVGAIDAAIACWRRVVEIAPRSEDGKKPDALFGRALTNIGHKLFHQGKFSEAAKATERAMECDETPEFPIANMAMLESVLGHNEKSLRLARKAYDISLKWKDGVGAVCDPIIEMQLAFSLLYCGKWIDGLRHFEARFPYKLKDFTQYPYPRWAGETDKESILFVASEMGMGDALSFMRFIPEAARRVGTLHLVVQPELVRLARALVQDWPNVQVQPLPSNFPEADAWCPMTSLPVALGLTDAEFESMPNLPLPGFQLPTSWKAKGRDRLGGLVIGREPLHVGIAWAGNPGNDIDRWRTIPFQQFLELACVPGVQLYGLQFGPHQQDIWNFGAGAIVRDVSPQVRDVADTVAIVKELDLVVTIESALGHICGCMAETWSGECWVAYSWNGGDYRVGRNREKPIWYSRHRIFKQGPDAEWGPVFERIVAALKERVKARIGGGTG